MSQLGKFEEMKLSAFAFLKYVGVSDLSFAELIVRMISSVMMCGEYCRYFRTSLFSILMFRVL